MCDPFSRFLLCLSLFQQPTGFNPISSLASDPYGYFQQSAFHHYPGGFGVSDGKFTLIKGKPPYLTNGLKSAIDMFWFLNYYIVPYLVPYLSNAGRIVSLLNKVVEPEPQETEPFAFVRHSGSVSVSGSGFGSGRSNIK
jgi:hypothetical protein